MIHKLIPFFLLGLLFVQQTARAEENALPEIVMIEKPSGSYQLQVTIVTEESERDSSR